MIFSNCLLSIIGTVISVIGTCSSITNLEYFGWEMLLVSFVNIIGMIVDMRKINVKDKKKQS